MSDTATNPPLASLATVAAPAQVDPVAAQQGKTAVIVFHGMGQQVPFESVDGLAALIAPELSADENRGQPHARARTASLGGKQVPRVELSLDADGRPLEPGADTNVHLYEVYWAPLTEGKIGLRGVVEFLVSAGLGGVTYYFKKSGVLVRWLFGKTRRYPLEHEAEARAKTVPGEEGSDPWNGVKGFASCALFLYLLAIVLGFLPAPYNQASAWLFWVGAGTAALVPVAFLWTAWKANPTTRYLSIAMVVFAALVVINGITAAVAASLMNPNAQWPGTSRLVLLSLELFLILAVMLGVVVAGFMPVQRARMAAIQDPGKQAALLKWGQNAAEWVNIGFATLCVGALLMGATASAPWDRFGGILDPYLGHVQPLLFVPIWMALGWATAQARNVLVQFLGDVAIYVSSHQCNPHFQTRHEIKKTSLELAASVYEHGGYDRIFLVAHSLGSVIAYDTLNNLLSDDAVLGKGRRTRERTKLFLTFGSPLDKIAYLFRIQGDRMNDIREALGAQVQPIISDPSTRPTAGEEPFLWVNIWSRADWISGDLNFYDVPEGEDQAPSRVCNWSDPHAATPGTAHNEYWTNPLLGNTLRAALGNYRHFAAVLRHPQFKPQQIVDSMAFKGRLPEPAQTELTPAVMAPPHPEQVSTDQAIGQTD